MPSSKRKHNPSQNAKSSTENRSKAPDIKSEEEKIQKDRYRVLIEDVADGFYEVDISGAEAKADWIELDIRPQFSFKLNYDELSKSVDEITEKIHQFNRSPIVELRIHGDKIETDLIQTQVSRLNELTLRCFWRISSGGL